MAKINPFLAAVIIAAIAGTATVVGLTYIPNATAQVTNVDAMTDITGQVQTALNNPNLAPSLQRENIKQADSLLFGKPVILETSGVNATIAISQDYNEMADTLKNALLSCSDFNCSDPAIKAEAKELADRITYWQEIKENLEVQTRDTVCDVHNPMTCPQLAKGDEPQAVGPGINVGVDKIWDGWYREIRSPYSINTDYLTAFGPHENIITTGPIGVNECSTIVKEIQGVKAIQRPVQIPIWQEPWTSRANVIGFDTVWVIDFVPAEFVKSLNYCNNGGAVVFDYRIDVIIERELTHFWKFLPGGY